MKAWSAERFSQRFLWLLVFSLRCHDIFFARGHVGGAARCSQSRWQPRQWAGAAGRQHGGTGHLRCPFWQKELSLAAGRLSWRGETKSTYHRYLAGEAYHQKALSQSLRLLLTGICRHEKPSLPIHVRLEFTASFVGSFTRFWRLPVFAITLQSVYQTDVEDTPSVTSVFSFKEIACL